MLALSGDQDRLLLPAMSWVRRVTSDPSAFTTQISELLTNQDWNAIREPSGDHDGSLLPTLP